LKRSIQEIIKESCSDILSGPNIIKLEIPTDWIFLENGKTFSDRLELDVRITKVSVEADGAALVSWNKIILAELPFNAKFQLSLLQFTLVISQLEGKISLSIKPDTFIFDFEMNSLIGSR